MYKMNKIIPFIISENFAPYAGGVLGSVISLHHLNKEWDRDPPSIFVLLFGGLGLAGGIGIGTFVPMAVPIVGTTSIIYKYLM